MFKSSLYIEPKKTFKELVNNSNANAIALGKPTIKLEFENNEELVNFQNQISQGGKFPYTLKVNEQGEFEKEPEELGEIDFELKNKEDLKEYLKENISPFRFVEYNIWNINKEFPDIINVKDINNNDTYVFVVKTALSYIYLRDAQLKKIVERNREKYFGLIKPTLLDPILIIKDNDNIIFVKSFGGIDKDLLIFISVYNDYDLFARSNYEKTLSNLWNKIKTKACAIFCYENNGYATTINGVSSTQFEIVDIPLFDCKDELKFAIKQNFEPKSLAAPSDLYIITDTRLKSKKDLDEIKALQKYNIQPFNLEEFASDTGVKLVSLKNIKKDTKRFQNRENAESSESVNRIINAVKKGDFNWAAFDPIVLWKDPTDGNIYVLSGHSRTRAFEILSEQGATVDSKNFNRIPAKFFEGSEQDAINFALNSNTLSTKETDVERAKYYRRLIGTMPEYKLKELAEQNEGKNANRILAYAHLKPGSYTLNALTRLQDSSTENAELVKTVADWIGRLFIQFPQLTLEHDKEIFNWLLLEGHYGVGAGKINNYQKLLDVIRLAVFRLQGKDGFESEKRLNLSNVGGESDSIKNYNEKLKQLNNELKNANAELKAKRKDFLQRQKLDNTITNIDIERALKPYNDKIIILQRQIINLSSNKAKYLDADKKQRSLFGISRQANIWNTTKLDCKGFKPTYKKLNSYDSFFNTSKNLDELAGYGINDTIYLIKDCVKKNYKTCAAIAQHLKANTIPQSIFNVWYWLHENIKYNYDAEGKEQLRTPERAWADREKGVDCDCLSIFAYCILLCMHLKPVFEIAKFNGKNQFSHIYVVCNNMVLDRVWPTFNEKAPFISEVKQFSVKIPTRLETLAGLF